MYRAYVLNEAGHIQRVYELRTCKDDADALTVLNGLARKHERLELWNGSQLVHKIVQPSVERPVARRNDGE